MSIREQLQLSDEDISITLRRAWDMALRTLAARVNKPTFETHIRAIRPLSLSAQTESTSGSYVEVTLGVPSAFTREWVEKRHSGLIAEALEESLDSRVRLRFVLAPGENRPRNSDSFAATAADIDITSQSEKSAMSGISVVSAVSAMPERADAPMLTLSSESGSAKSERDGAGFRDSSSFASMEAAVSRPGKTATAAGRGEAESSSLNPRYTFDCFVIGQSNRLAHAGSQAVAQSPGQVYNPLFLYGAPGMGKTHLMHAIGNEIARSRAESGSGGRVAYVSGETFTTHFITSLREQKTAEFRRRWRSVDVWLVDDIQFIAGKESTKEEFFHTFNALYQGGKQIVISSDQSPRELRTMDERLRSRFESGLVADIGSPDLETRLAILQRKAATERSFIPDDVLLYVARLIDNNIRTLEGALIKLIAYASMVKAPVSTEMASSVLEQYYASAARNSAPSNSDTTLRQSGPASWSGMTTGVVSPEVIQRIVAYRFGLTPDALTGRRRDRDVAAARQLAMHLVRELTPMSLPGIGKFFGGRNHSTVLYACERVRAQMPIDSELRQLVEDLTVQTRAMQQAPD